MVEQRNLVPRIGHGVDPSTLEDRKPSPKGNLGRHGIRHWRGN